MRKSLSKEVTFYLKPEGLEREKETIPCRTEYSKVLSLVYLRKKTSVAGVKCADGEQ